VIDSKPAPKLFQVRPKKRVRPLGFTEDGWYTLDGFLYESDKLARCVQWARRRYFNSEFTFFVSINITQDLTAADMKAVWSKACRYLTGKKVVAMYTCEVSRRSNRFNYHLLVRSQTPDLMALLKFATKTVKTNIKVEAYNPGEGRFTVRYMVKAKTAKYHNGEIVSRDRWARKRVLLRRELKMRKYGFIGPFWPQGMNKESIWKEIVAHERKINDGLQQPGAEEYAAELHELIGGYFSLQRVRRSVGFLGVPAGWVPKLDDELVVVNDHDEADVELPAPAPSDPPPQEAVKPLRMAVEAPIMVGVSFGPPEWSAAFYGPLTTSTTPPTPTARPPPQRVDFKGRRLNLPLHLPFRPIKTQGISAGGQVQRLVRHHQHCETPATLASRCASKLHDFRTHHNGATTPTTRREAAATHRNLNHTSQHPPPHLPSPNSRIQWKSGADNQPRLVAIMWDVPFAQSCKLGKEGLWQTTKTGSSRE
jgi:hypothetical protein